MIHIEKGSFLQKEHNDIKNKITKDVLDYIYNFLEKDGKKYKNTIKQDILLTILIDFSKHILINTLSLSKNEVDAFELFKVINDTVFKEVCSTLIECMNQINDEDKSHKEF